MHRFLRYSTKTGDVTSMFSMSTNDVQVLPSAPDEGIIEVTNGKHLKMLDAMDPFAQDLTGRVEDSAVRELRVVSRFRGLIVLTTDVKDLDGDGRPELPPDGTSKVKVRATLEDDRGRVVSDAPAKIRFSTSRGALSRRDVAAKKGVADVELRATNETTTVVIAAEAEGFQSASLVIEVIPQADYDEYHRR